MAAASYTTDLTNITLAASGWSEPVGATAGGLPGAETDYFIEGTSCQSKNFNTTGLGGMCFDNGSGVTITSGSAAFHWLYWGAPNSIATLASGGYRVMIGSATNAYKMWYVLGNDTYTYGGWVNIAVDPTITPDATQGTPSSTTQVFGSVINNSNPVAKGNPYGNDAIRWGKTLQITGGDVTNGYATFAGAASTNDTSTNRWGLFQVIDGGYLQKGLFLMGTSGTAVDFRDSNRYVVIQNTTKVSSSFNTFEVRNSSSTVSWTQINITALGTTARGNFIATDNANIDLDTCTFTDMGTFGFLGNTTATSCTFRRCNLVTQSSATLTNCTFDSTNDSTKALLSNNPGNISSCTFISSGTKHAIQINTAGTYSFNGNNFTGYATTDGSTGNEVIYNTSGGLVTLNVTTSGVGTISVRNDGVSTTTINNTVDLEINGVTYNARCRIEKQSDGTQLLSAYATTDDGSGNGTYKATASYNYPGSPVNVNIIVRQVGFLPYLASGQVTESGLTVTPVWQTDSISDKVDTTA